MTEQGNLRAEFDRLLAEACEGFASPQALSWLEHLFAQHAELQLHYLIYMHMRVIAERRNWSGHVSATNDDSTGIVQPTPASGFPAIPESRLSPTRGDAPPSTGSLGFLGPILSVPLAWLSSPRVLALTVVGCLATYFLGLVISLAITRAYLDDRKIAGQLENSVPSQARIIATDDAHWQGTPPVGQLPSGVSRLAAGTAEIEFDSGARIWVEGPAEFVPRASNRVDLNRGRLMAYVPRPARGFIVGTPTAELIDLGTEFGVDVDTAGKTDVHVLQGTVEVKPSAPGSGAASQKVTAGQAVRVSPGAQNANVASTEFTPGKFVRPAPPGTAKISRNKSRSKAEAAADGSAKVPANFAEYGLEVHGFQDFFAGRDFEPGWTEVTKEQECRAGSTRNFTLPGDATLHVNPTRDCGDPNKLLYGHGAYGGNRQTMLAMIKVVEPLGMSSDGWRGGVSVACNPATADGVSILLRHGPPADDAFCFYTQFIYDRHAWGPASGTTFLLLDCTTGYD